MLGLPSKFSLHGDRLGPVQFSYGFPFSNGVKQGYVFAPILLSICLSMMLLEVEEYSADGSYISFWTRAVFK